ncbi:hypothetical protein CCR90_09790 [Rhodovulum sulfidophilum]|uniref:hypothetical protein n=1 Tax=Rhodovulum sulfidophilum TaxID=35806 RepID=UPI00191208CB|nr:hypothetical protein [Rhodovulum sulfidophilum]MBK5924058.1 hypothetical protein [Rhodovulum sulfidophilum]
MTLYDSEIEAVLGGAPEPEASETVTAAELGEWLNLSPARLHALAREGIIPWHEGRFDLRKAIRAYVEHVRAGQKGRLTSNPDLAAQKLRLAQEQADKLAIANAKTRGELLDAKTVAATWARTLTDLRAAMLAIPQRVAGRCALDRPTAGALDDEIRAALEALADEA